MKKVFLTLMVFTFSAPVFAQLDKVQDSLVTHYLFSDFITGMVKQKSLEPLQLQLNYNTLTEEMIFIRDTQMLAVAYPQQIDSVYLGGKVFVPVKNAFYEKATNTAVPLYIQNKTTLLLKGKDIGYGNKIQTGAIGSVRDFISSTKVYKLQLPLEYTLADNTHYWVYSKEQFVQVTGAKKLQSMFPAKARAIKTFIQDNNIKFDNREDMVKLIEFCNQPGQ